MSRASDASEPGYGASAALGHVQKTSIRGTVTVGRITGAPTFVLHGQDALLWVVGIPEGSRLTDVAPLDTNLYPQQGSVQLGPTSNSNTTAVAAYSDPGWVDVKFEPPAGCTCDPSVERMGVPAPGNPNARRTRLERGWATIVWVSCTCPPP